MKQIKYIIAAAAALVFGPALHAQLKPVMVDKTATQTGENAWTLTLKSYATGVVNPYETRLPADLIFVMDLSGSMKDPVGKDDTYSEVNKPMTAVSKAVKETVKAAMTATTNDKVTGTAKNPTVVTKAMSSTDRTSSTTKNWTYGNVTANADGTQSYSHFYKDANGDYYALRKWSGLLNSDTGKNNVYAIGYVDKNGNTWYLTTDGVSSTYKDITATGTTQWNGTLYKGWTYKTHSNDSGTQCRGLDNGNADATDASQWYYLHTDGEYYPVRRAANLPDGNGNNDVYAAWVVINGVTWYLHGDKLDTTYDKTMKSQYRAIWFAPLYKGGWTYKTILAATVENGHYYKHTDGKYYAVQKEDLGADAGNGRYQAFVEVPEGKRYLYGSGLSTEPCPFSLTTTVPFYFGELYTGGWTYNITTDGSTGTKHYYLHTDGEYYPVRKETSTNNFQLYVDVPEGKRYFDGNGLSETPYALSTTKYVTVYFGSFYTMTGWSYAGVTAATAGAGHYYKHTNDKYYPVLKEDLGADHTANRYQLYVEVPEGKRYLWGHQLHSEVCPYSAATATVIWYGTLYKGGWSYSTITVNASDKQGYSYLHSDGEYYPIFQETVTINGATTYQDYVILPDGNKWYLCGSEVSRNPYPYTIKNTVNNWFGPLYSGAWTYAGVTAGNLASGHYYLHTDGEYYPVLKEDLGTASAANRYQLYVNVPEGKRYLYSTHLSETPFPFSARTNVAIYYTSPLYQGGWNYSNISNGTATGGHHYLHTDGKYYPVTKEDLGSGQSRYQAYVVLPELGKMYLYGNSISSEPYPTSSVTGASFYFGPLYKLTQYNYTKYVGMNRAVAATIEELALRAQEGEGTSYRVALVQYGNASWKAVNKGIAKPHLKSYTNSAAGGNSAVVMDFRDLREAAQVQDLLDVLPTERTTPAPTTGYTREGWGLSLARGLFLREGGDTAGSDFDGNTSTDDYEVPIITGTDKTNYEARQKVVIVIGDGEDNDSSGASAPSGWSYSGYSGHYKEPKFWADQLKADVEDVKVFVIHVSTKNTSAVVDFENYVSSNHNKPADDTTEYRYAVQYYDEQLTEALISITGEIGGAAIELGSDAIVQDVLTPEFSIPEGAVIRAYTANCIGGDDTALVFEGEEDWAVFDLTGKIQTRANADGTTTVRVTGFDFTANWCGNHGTEEGYKGKQLILQIPIIPKEGIVGGEIPTNTPASQILDGDEKPVTEYPIPYVGPFPIRIEIEKSGLLAGDSAVFLIWRKHKEASGGFVKTGNPYMKVVLTGEDGVEAVTAVIENLDPDYYYLIEESGWSWKYTPDVLSISTEDQTMNPFKFKNTLKDVTTKNGEAKAKNEFF